MKQSDDKWFDLKSCSEAHSVYNSQSSCLFFNNLLSIIISIPLSNSITIGVFDNETVLNES